MYWRKIALLASLAALALPASAHAAFPGDIGKIAYSRYAAQGEAWGYNVFAINPDGSGVTNLTPGVYRVDEEPDWSADGKKIVFASRDLFSGPSDLYTINADGSDVARITHLTNAELPYTAAGPTWSPDSSKIAFHFGAQVWVMKSDGTGLTNVTPSGFRVEGPPAWSPKGDRIAMAGAHSSLEDPAIYTMRPDGSDLQVAVPGLWFRVDWSPDGSMFVMDGFGANDYVWIANTDGSGLHGFPATHGTENPIWSPDGTKIAFGRITFEGTAIEVMNADGSDIHAITPLDSSLEALAHISSWQPIPNHPPDCSNVAASRPVLTTANRKLVPITLDGATDSDGDPVTLSVEAVTQDEPVTGRGDATAPDAIDERDGELRVRAERNPHGDGRVYRIAFTASDNHGGSCSGTATVSVPRKKHKPAVDSAPPSYDSFAG